MPATTWAQRRPQSDARDLWHHWYKGLSDPNVGEGPWDIGNASHPRRLGATRVRPRAFDGSWRCDSRMPKNTSIGGVGKKLWGFEWGAT